MAKNKKGRTRTHDRETDDTQGLLGSSLKIKKQHTIAVIETESKEIDDSLRKNYRNRIQHIIDFLKEKYPKYYKIGVRKLPLAPK